MSLKKGEIRKKTYNIYNDKFPARGVPERVVVVGVGGGFDEVEAGGPEAQLHGARVQLPSHHVVATRLNNINLIIKQLAADGEN